MKDYDVVINWKYQYEPVWPINTNYPYVVTTGNTTDSKLYYISSAT